MTLPNAQLALVEREKITQYLLNPAHPDNGGKAPFFTALGFQREDWKTLSAALSNLALTAPISLSMETMHGKKLGVTQLQKHARSKCAFLFVSSCALTACGLLHVSFNCVTSICRAHQEVDCLSEPPAVAGGP